MEAQTVFRVRYGETDRMGVVYHTAYIDWFALGRTEWMREQGVPYREAFEDTGVYLPVVSVACRYRRSVTYDDAVTVVTALDALSPTRIRFRYTVLAPDGQTAAEGTTEHAFLDGPSARPVNLAKARPDLWEALRAMSSRSTLAD